MKSLTVIFLAFVYSTTTDTVTEYTDQGPKETRTINDIKNFRF